MLVGVETDKQTGQRAVARKVIHFQAGEWHRYVFVATCHHKDTKGNGVWCADAERQACDRIKVTGPIRMYMDAVAEWHSVAAGLDDHTHTASLKSSDFPLCVFCPFKRFKPARELTS